MLWLGSVCVAAPAQPEVTLHLWHVPAKRQDNPIPAARRAIFEAFCRKYPWIKTRLLVPLEIEGPAAQGNRFLAVAGGVAPDVFLLPGNDIADYNHQGFLYPLNDLLADYARRHSEPYRGISAIDQVWQVCHDRGRIVAVPYLEYFQTIYCRKDLFARAGLGDRVPQDWQELYEFARRLTWDPSKEPGADANAPRVYGLRILTGLIAGWNYL